MPLLCGTHVKDAWTRRGPKLFPTMKFVRSTLTSFMKTILFPADSSEYYGLERGLWVPFISQAALVKANSIPDPWTRLHRSRRSLWKERILLLRKATPKLQSRASSFGPLFSMDWRTHSRRRWQQSRLQVRAYWRSIILSLQKENSCLLLMKRQ